MNQTENQAMESIIADIVHMLHRFDSHRLLRVLHFVRRIW